MNSNEFYQQHHFPEDDEIDLAELWYAIWSGKLLIIAISGLFAISSIIYAINQPNIYKATTLLAPASEQGGAGGLAKMAGQFGGLASLAGINLGGGGTDKTGLALEVLKSRVFLESFINKHQLLVPLMAAKSWDVNSNTLIINDEIYNETTNKWLREVKAPKKPEPSSWEAYKAFKEILTITSDKETGMITLAIEHYSPEIATQWLLWLVSDINEAMRDQDKAEAQRSIDYLTTKLQETQLADMQTVFYQLIEQQTKTIMLAEVSLEYVLKTIDPANAPEEKAKPKRALIVVLGTMLGGILSVLIVLIRYFTKKGAATKLSNTKLVANNKEADSMQPTQSSQVLGK
ncbi:LPS O-antigen length regulator [Colwellia sp. BRX10-3]|uniref:Wzz/FepE/Etk N-terminal domain-containing protein n=1 Tax=Colwellia sp. BRX10-3 TaxID=2759844 RepID=UPI0015F49891|nr:Wzz/FepE/Etk N-terminal domain-containing protein [Colwellia sp. BRX10-3]MBA6389412.1 LPS O-antigen length regulator [Colwellia sp. BRX10-3]